MWCDDRGFVMEDGVVFRHSDDDFLLTAARPNLGWFADLAGSLRVQLEDVSDEYGILAVQGPRSRAALASVMPEVSSLGFFDHAQAKLASAPVTLSRTGYTGDLGFEVTVESAHAVDVLDAVLEAGAPHSMRPFGEEALMMLRIEAGLPLIDVEWHNSRLAFTDADRVTPKELGVGWMLRGVRDCCRTTVPSWDGEAIRRELTEGTSRWATRRHRRRLGRLGPAAPRRRPAAAEVRAPAALRVGAVRRRRGRQPGRLLTSFVYSPVLQRHIGLARVRPDLAAAGTEVRLETRHRPPQHHGAARTAKLPVIQPAEEDGPQ